MPFEKIINTAVGTIGIWQLTDTLNNLLEVSNLSTSDLERYKSFTFEKRKKEFLAVRILLQKISNKKYKIEYANSGKPFLKDSKKQISISHSADFVCVFLSDNNIGIDVEQSTRSIDRVAARFLHPDEQKHFTSEGKQQEAKILYWAAKEAIFKCSAATGIKFNQQILIEAFELKNEGSFNGYLQLPEETVHFKLQYFFIKNNAFVYCIEK